MEAVKASPDGGGMALPLALAGFGDKATAKVRKALVAYMIASTAVRVGKGWYEKAKEELLYGVALQGDDDIYADVHGWLIDQLPAERRKMMIAKSGRRRGDDAVPQEIGAPKSDFKLKLFYDGSRSQVVDIEGHRIKVWVERPDISAGLGSDMDKWLQAKERMIFQARGVEARDAVLRVLERMTAARGEQKTTRIFVANKYGGWDRRRDMPLRSLESVVLREGQKEALVEDLASFFGHEGAYNDLGIPWHRGYFLEGPPGTGKTSLARALAVHFKMDLYYIPLAALSDDGSLLQCMNNIEPRSMLLLEDIDIVHGARERDDTEPGISLSGLLNCLDGLITPHGLVSVLTSNDAKVIDPALLRKGRVDRTEHLGFVDHSQLLGLAELGLGRRIDLPSPARDLSPAEVVEAIKRNLGNEEDAIGALKELANDKG